LGKPPPLKAEPEWEHAPLQAFTLAMRAAYGGNRRFVEDLAPLDLSRTAETRFGVMTLGQFLLSSDAFVSAFPTEPACSWWTYGSQTVRFSKFYYFVFCSMKYTTRKYRIHSNIQKY
jgi:hypothetical protein